MPSIAISYRRADTGQIAGRIFDRLEAHFGKNSVFMDIDGVPIGVDFRDRVKSVLSDCDAVVVLVGPHWADGGANRDRLSDEADWVRIEVETALANKVPVVPVLIDQAQFPPPDTVPEGVRDIVFKQAARVDTGIDFGPHMERLIRAIEGTISPAAHAPRSPPARAPTTPFSLTSLLANRKAMIGIGAASVAVVVVVALWFVFSGHPVSDTDTSTPVDTTTATAADGSLHGMEAAPMNAEVRTAFERARSSAAAATHAAITARESKVQARLAALEAARHTADYGEIDDTNGDGAARQFTGGVRGNTPDGYGIITIPSRGTTYSGQVDNGAITGTGVFSHDPWKYEGEFRDGAFNGVGVWSSDATESAEHYSGDFVDGLEDGFGLRTFNPGRVYFGQWRRGKRNGYGITFDAAGAPIEQGIYEADTLVRSLTATVK